jgi:type VI secretion system protein ImpF
MPALVSATALPLFDRLTGRVEGAVDGAMLDAIGIRQSLERELFTLLNTRSPLTIGEFLARDLTVIDYGLPDFTTLSVQSEADRGRLADVLLKALAVFEPRLSRVHVAVRARESNPMAAVVSIQAAVVLGRELRRVDFELAASAQGLLWTN